MLQANHQQMSKAYYAARDAGVDFSEYDADRIEYRKTTPAEAAKIAADDRAARAQVAKRRTLERRVVRHAVRALKAAGYSLRLHDGEAWSTPHRASETQIMDAMQATDMERLYAFNDDGKSVGALVLVYGNSGWDVISDYSTSLDEALKETNEYADKLDQ